MIPRLLFGMVLIVGSVGLTLPTALAVGDTMVDGVWMDDFSSDTISDYSWYRVDHPAIPGSVNHSYSKYVADGMLYVVGDAWFCGHNCAYKVIHSPVPVSELVLEVRGRCYETAYPSAAGYVGAAVYALETDYIADFDNSYTGSGFFPNALFEVGGYSNTFTTLTSTGVLSEPRTDFVFVLIALDHWAWTSNNLTYAIYDYVTVRTVGRPVADAGPDQTIHAGQVVDLDGSGSYDDDTPSVDLAYAWTLTSRPPGSAAVLTDAETAMPSFLADLPGTYAASLVVTDAAGLHSEPDAVEVSSCNLAPTANAGADMGAIVGDLVQLDGSQSFDPDLDPLAYVWSLTAVPEGSTASLAGATTARPDFVADLAGPYSVELVVNDGFQDSEPCGLIVSVVTAEDFAESNTVSGLNVTADLPPASVSTEGNQTALGNFLTQTIAALQTGDTEKAVSKLSKALSRTDGCVLRGEPDGPGPGRDWIIDCVAQESLYWLLRDALDAISP